MPTKKSNKRYLSLPDPDLVSEKEIVPSTLENIDYSLFEWVDEELNISADTNKGWKKVPVIWVSGERSFQVKNNKDLRDSSGTLILPMITVERTAVVKDLANKGVFYGNVPPVNDERGGSIVVTRHIMHEKTANFKNAQSLRWKKQRNFPDNRTPGPPLFDDKHDLAEIFGPTPEREKSAFRFNNRSSTVAKEIVFKEISVPMPVHVNVSYTITLKSEYQQQMNDMVAPFFTKTGGINHFFLQRDEHLYEGFIQGDFGQTNNLAAMQIDERLYQTEIVIEVLGYLMGADKNQHRPTKAVREGVAKVVFPRERVVTGQSLKWSSSDKKFYVE